MADTTPVIDNPDVPKGRKAFVPLGTIAFLFVDP